MKKSIKINATLPEEYKPLMGDAISTRSDSHKTVDVHNQTERSRSRMKETIARLFAKAQINTFGVNYYESSRFDGIHLVYDERCNVMLGGTKVDIGKKINQAKRQRLKHKVYNIDGYVFLVVYKKVLFEAQSGIFNTVYTQLNNVLEFYKSSKNAASTVISKEFGLFVMDLMRLILDIRDGWITGSKIITTLMSLYSLFHRFKDVKRKFESQVYFLNDTTFDSLILTFSLIGVPKSILDILKVFTDITGRKLYNSNFVLSIVSSLYELFKGFVAWMCESLPGCFAYMKVFEAIIDYLFSTIVCYSKIKKVVELYSKYVAESMIILDPKFRIECEELHDKLKRDITFREYIDNVDNKHFRSTWDSFNNNLMKYVKNFDTSKRDEPICIILEGKPGCGKSVLMNNLVQYLLRINLSVYVHSVPPTDGGKDFYDDYENQDVFIMDDVGAQGKSQWRTIINFVAPVKYPLECADAKKKNTKFFNSKYIICTTNCFTGLQGFTSSDCIAEPGALFRRAHVLKVRKSMNARSHLVDLSYFKYDYKNSSTFVNQFLYHNKTDSIPTSVDNLNTKESLTYVMKIFKHLIATEEANRKSSLLSEDDLRDIDHYLNDDFEAQFKISDYMNTLRDAFPRLGGRGLDIFEEWYDCVKRKILTFVTDCMDYLRALAYPIVNDELVRILVSKCPFTVLGVSPGKDELTVKRAYKELALKYHPDKHGDVNRELYTIIFQIINRAYQAIIQGVLFLNEPQFYDNLEEHDKFATDFYDYLYSVSYKLRYYYYSLSAYDKMLVNTFGVYMGICISVYIFGWINDNYNRKDEDLLDKWTKQANDSKDWDLNTTGLQDSGITDTVTNTVKKCIRFVVGKRADGEIFYSQCVVGGRFVLLNSHTNADKAVVDIYHTYEHYRNNHKEQEAVTIVKVRDFPSVDLCVYRLVNVQLVYRAPRLLFGGQNTQVQRVAYPFMYLISSLGVIPISTAARLTPNQEEVKYSSYGSHFSHKPKTGYITDIEGKGLCGSVLVNPHGVIMGVHVAGDGVRGFCATPSDDIIRDIRDLLCSEADAPYDIDSKIYANFSGVRLRYDKDAVKVSYVGGDVPMIPTVLHRDNCEDMRRLIGVLHDDTNNDYSPVLPDDKRINNRKPPNLTAKPAEKLKETARKTFKQQGYVTDEELAYIGKCIESLLPESFDDVSFDEAAFGDELASLAKDTSNGYGHARDKKDYFDFENKVITDGGLSEIEAFKDRVESGRPIFKDFLSKEVFKVDELRNEEKCDKPRTIRVMPVTHIFWTKVIFGNLAKHFKKFMHETGVCIGLNPYKDFDTIAQRFKACASLYGDADFGGWDGTLNARIMLKIFEVLKSRYIGKYEGILDFLSITITRSMVLVSDELYATTHGMPSGTWLTLLLNCLVNRALTALTIYRNKDCANVDDFSSVISYVTGDDIIFAVPKHLEEVFNLFTLREVAESLGMTCTNGDKSAIDTKGQQFHKLNYLKRHFRFHPVLKQYVGCLSLSTILNTLQYYNGTKNVEEVMQGKINAVAVESYIHSRNLYLLVRDFIKNNCPEYMFLPEDRVINILSTDDGYLDILDSLGKNYARA